MPDRLKDILSHLSTEVDQETLLKYLEGRLSEEQKHEVEKKMLASEFSDDAMEGLQEIKNKKDLSSLVEQLNRDLHKKLEKKKQRREKFRIKDQPWLYITIVIILLLIIISFVVVYRMLQQ
jgi:chromatin segregation and condensation protein Rec8/ScpA/Scc1 (kleisin family)